MYNVYLKRTIDGKTDTIHISNDWSITYHSKDPFTRINASYFREPGEYEILVAPEPPTGFTRSVEMIRKLPFTVLPGKMTSFSLKELLILLAIVITIALLIFWYLRKKHQRKLGSEMQKKEMISLQLRSVRDSLNPHFIFNALAGIQNLMNKKDTDNANLYLSRFARITRSVLNTRENDRISMKEEISLLEDYLQMEQLRFGFKYYIYKDEKLDENNIEIPVLLIQPFVENAIKHGISSLKQDGQIDIRLKKTNNQIIVEIEDNGKGFDTSATKKGMGISLTEKRIELLNSANKPAFILLEKNSGDKGTVISIILENWL
jgi:sensor histidine kinase YesM